MKGTSILFLAPVTTSAPDRDEKMEELDRLLAEDSPRGEHLRRLRDLIRVEVFGLEPLCPECEEEESAEPESEPQKEQP